MLADFAHLGFSMLPHVGVIVFTDGEPLSVIAEFNTDWKLFLAASRLGDSVLVCLRHTHGLALSWLHWRPSYVLGWFSSAEPSPRVWT